MRKIVLLLLMLCLCVGCASREDKIDLCFDDLIFLESGMFEPTKHNVETCLGNCYVALKSDPGNSDIVITMGKMRWVYGLKNVACKDFALAMAMGNSSAFLEYCNADGSPNEKRIQKDKEDALRAEKLASPEWKRAALCIEDADKIKASSSSLWLWGAEENCASGIKSFPDDSRVATAQGIVLMNNDKPKEACEAFMRAKALGDSFEFTMYCNADGSPKE
ncbi:hypothetical protein GO013_07400 [Pseudodesulfovibrio sp. JC047]|uniref:hypothetical protein n=1 Tax=Pseudodesulfovibrio sp. JC047 TaxID=2683199 RepID=UPI0013D89DDE|nr:hypothetical protein [Pseudodesulfovibrio sp. JC047]NDV19244.1 hypothetical protein [Pseudodesulfovibrio sp. JC047]